MDYRNGICLYQGCENDVGIKGNRFCREHMPHVPVSGVVIVNTSFLALLVKSLRGSAEEIEKIMETAGPATACQCEVVHNIECPVGVELRKKRSEESQP